MKRISILLLLLNGFFVIPESLAQQKDPEYSTVNVSKITILEPGFSQEIAMGKTTTVMFRAGITATLATDINNEEITGVLFRAFGAASFRAYYNFEKRSDMGKSVRNNSANYIGLLTMYASRPFNKGNDYDPDLNNTLLNIGIVWGLQRVYRSGFSLDLNIGPGYAKAGGNINGFTLVGEFTLGWRLGKRQN